MKKHQNTVGKNDEWLTPPWILDALGDFDLDPCSPRSKPWSTANKHYTIEDDGLSKNWEGRVWLNPPFNRYERPKWMAKMAEHGNGIMLVPAAFETNAFIKNVWGRSDGVLALNKRPHFHYIDGTPSKANSGCTIVLIAYGKNNFNSLMDSGLGTLLTECRQAC